jgi:7,8-dihydropterin-6-yl-methyl-4-(beta-D-ribofuranosyl)aminobenzene 5'-phosphate synthase
MKITVLTENHAGGRFLAEHGLSYLIEYDGQKILFDTGRSDVFLRNAELLGINIHNEVKTVVLSHGHWDHGDGLRYLNGKILIMHPLAFMKRYRLNDRSNMGLTLSKNELEEKFKLITSEKPYTIAPNLYFLGEIPRLNDFEAKETPFIDENGDPDFVPDDSALAVMQKNELTIITGCSHSGICNIIEYAKKVTGVDKVHGVIGGFHLKDIDVQTTETIQYFKKQRAGKIYPSHCTELPALTAFYNVFDIVQLKTGMIVTL